MVEVGTHSTASYRHSRGGRRNFTSADEGCHSVFLLHSSDIIAQPSNCPSIAALTSSILTPRASVGMATTSVLTRCSSVNGLPRLKVFSNWHGN